jgi:hypothetical protein
MAQLIRIKRSTTSATPSALEQGELAYSSNSDKLFIGNPGTSEVVAIGGKVFADMLDHTAGVVTANSALIVDADGKLDVLDVDNIQLNGNSIVSTDPNGNISLIPNGSGNLVLDGVNWPQTAGTTDYFLTTDGNNQSSWVGIIQATGFEIESVLEDPTPQLGGNLDVNGNTIVSTSGGNIVITPDTTGSIVLDGVNWPQADGAPGQYLVTSGEGQTSWSTPAAGEFSVSADIGSTDVFTLGETINFAGGTGITTTVSNNQVSIATTITQYTDALARAAISVTDAGGDGSLVYNSSTGIITYTGPSAAEIRAHFSAGAAITLTDGAISIADAAIANVKLANSSVTLGTTEVALGAASTSLEGITELTVDNLNFNGNEITSVDTDGDISLNPNGNGTVDVNGSRISGLAEPVNASDAATKGYVDSVAEGLHVHASAHALVATPLATVTGGAVVYDNGTGGVGATLTLSSAVDIAGGDLDGDTDIAVGDRVIIAGEANAAHNGIYVLTSTTILTRAADFDTPTEMAGGDFIFVTHGTQYADTGWVLGEPVLSVGNTAVQWIQFSGAGSLTAGEGITQSGTEFSVNVAAEGGIEISAGDLQLKSTVAGAGLTYTSGVVAVVGTDDRMTVTADAIDIASTYIGQTSITTLGTITTGTWNGNTITEAHGGTNQTSYSRGDILYATADNTLAKLAIGTAGQMLMSDGTDVAWANIDGGTFD